MHPGSKSRKARQEELKALVIAAAAAADEETAKLIAAAETFDPEAASPTDEPFTEELDYHAMTVVELKALCAESNLAQYGTKAELIERLNLNELDSTEAPVETAAEEDTANPVETAVAQGSEVSESNGEERQEE